MSPASGPFHVRECHKQKHWNGVQSGCSPTSMTRFLPLSLRTGLLALITLALLTVPFAHRAGAAPVTPQMAQFLAMGGNLADICGETGGHINAGCESCQIVGAMLLPAPAQTPRNVSFHKINLNGLQPQNTADLAVRYGHPPVRGPPRS